MQNRATEAEPKGPGATLCAGQGPTYLPHPDLPRVRLNPSTLLYLSPRKGSPRQHWASGAFWKDPQFFLNSFKAAQLQAPGRAWAPGTFIWGGRGAGCQIPLLPSGHPVYPHCWFCPICRLEH